MNFALLSHPYHSCTPWNLPIIPSWSLHLENGSSSCCGEGAVSPALPCCSHRSAAAPQQWPAWLPTACSTGKITGNAVFFKGKLQYGWGGWFWLQALYFTAPWRVDVACGLPLDFLQSWPYPDKMFLPPQTSSEIHSWHFLATLPSFGVCLCVMDSVESQEEKVEVRTETTCRVSSSLPLEPDPNDITAAGSFFALMFQVCKRELWFSPADDCSVYT